MMAALLAAWMWECCQVRLEVRGPAGQAVAGARIEIAGLAVDTNEAGLADVQVAPGVHIVEVTAEGFSPQRREVAIAADVALTFTLIAVERQSVTVTERAPDASAPTAGGLTREQARLLPADPPRVRDALPLIPGILRGPTGNLTLSGSPEYRSTFQINGLDVTDPMTGGFGRTVPMDSVAVLNVYRSPFLTEFGRFATDVVAVETRRGGDKWFYELNDPTPEFRIRSRRIVGIRGFTPRFSYGGPLIKTRLYFTQSIEYALRKIPSFTLAFPNNEERQEGWNALTQFDAIPTARQWLTVTLHGAPQRNQFVRPGLYNPLAVTPTYRGHEYRGAIAHKWTIRGGLLESALSGAQAESQTYGQGDQMMILTPTQNEGNYFLRQQRRSQRWQWREIWTPSPWLRRGAHNVKLGLSAARVVGSGEYRANPFLIRDVGVTGFRNMGPYQLADTELGGFLQDHWIVSPVLALDAGLRTDWQQRTGRTRTAPRIALSWSPWRERPTVLRAGYGWFYDRVPLSVFSFPQWPWRLPGGNLLVNEGRFAPSNRTFQASMEHRFPKVARLRVSYVDSNGRGLIVLQPRATELVLADDGRSRYQHVEILGRFSYKPDQEFMVSYIRSNARGNLNEISEFLGDFPAPVIRPDFVAESSTNAPHRVLAWGVFPVFKSWRVAPTLEYRTGFPWSSLDLTQNYAEPPNSRRFPLFFSFDFRVSRDFAYRSHVFRISLSFYNLTNHWNPDTVRFHTADRLFGQYLGQHSRRFRLDFDFLK